MCFILLFVTVLSLAVQSSPAISDFSEVDSTPLGELIWLTQWLFALALASFPSRVGGEK